MRHTTGVGRGTRSTSLSEFEDETDNTVSVVVEDGNEDLRETPITLITGLPSACYRILMNYVRLIHYWEGETYGHDNGIRYFTKRNFNGGSFDSAMIYPTATKMAT